ncbi:MAG: putative toxin-antitoxin system toxin component, PIN family [Candidatus Altiarchaeales archaeon WOR_SM1_86-2]|nr:MAG: putative toxin-antitoxin system toxin component, PIN family [Candidatus Altiarchaeales archaeon WOR_SM1_86-2]ODS39556.1 MAG: putative toxin-antitoxin system toxin component, PIN family [Candidatus Altiarchaeales archaeon WOR_SM1_79]
MRVVLDTNTLISAFGWDGNERKIFNLCIDGKIKLCMSYDLLKELERVIEYPRLKFTDEQKKRSIGLLLEVAEFVEPDEKINLIKDDPDDNKVVECAVASSAQYIVSGDKHLSELGEFRSIKIVRSRDLLETV